MTSKGAIRVQFTLSVLLVVAIVLEACDEGKFGEGCNLDCHCQDPTVCDKDTGTCHNLTDCQSGWAGPTCQIKLENVALGKNAYGEPLKRKTGHSPEMAVDGNLTTYTWLQNSENNSVYWHVDLERSYNIHTIRVIFYDPEQDAGKVQKRRPGFTVIVKQRENEAGELCHQDMTTQGTPEAVQSFTNCTFTGRYVILENYRNKSEPVPDWSALPNLELVEVEVLADAECSDGTYGDQCDQLCGYCMDMICDRKTGFCKGECKESFYGSSCNMACPNQCPKCHQDGSCDGCLDNRLHGDYCNETCMPGCFDECYQNGTCINDCQAGFYGDVCDKDCSLCSISASCSCNRYDGKCLCGCKDLDKYGEYCNEPCASINADCIQCKGSLGNGVCLSCNSTNYGDKCEVGCPKTCLRCVSDVNCTECKPGNRGQTCGDVCKSGLCNKCDSNGDCLECTLGLKGKECNETCAQDCETCEAIGNKCKSCLDGYYLEKSKCIPCSLSIKKCKKCTKNDNCTSCQDAFYGPRCDKCPENCETCSNDMLCHKCKENWYGSQCKCSEKCNPGQDKNNITSWCSVNTGNCMKGCKDGYFSEKCTRNCSDNCSRCDQQTGACSQCSAGLYGSFCENTCGNCDKCDVESGECLGKCSIGFYGKFCNLTCSSKCDMNQCEKLSGNCSSCPSGYFGSQCDSACNPDCDQETCDQYNGTCNGCKDRLYGPQCTEECTNCVSCKQTGYCDYCLPKFYGDSCQIPCPENCGPDPWTNHSKTECNRKDGGCMFCKAGFYLYNCTKQCGSHCLKSNLGLEVCDMSNGDCLSCVPGYYGSQCESQCNKNCANDKEGLKSNGSCDQGNGQCTVGCVHGWYDTDCSQQCNNTCKHGICNMRTAACLSCVDGYQGVYCEKKLPDPAGVPMIPIIIGVLVAMVIIGVVFLIRWLRKRRENDVILTPVRKNLKKEIVYTNINGHAQNPPLPNRDEEHDVEMAVVNGESVPLMYDKISDNSDEPEAATYYNLDTRIPVSTFTENLQRRKINNAVWYKDEFGKLPKGLLKSCAIAKSPKNKGKCRYQMLYPYDDNRVVLEPESNENSDFINASYVNGYKKPQAFIASQGPIDVNVDDFWRMIFQQDCGKIVMLTKLFEECKLKCVRYWPELQEKEMYGNYEVTMVSETVYPDYVLRHLEAQHTETKEAKEFKQFHFMSWPDCGVPESPSNMLNFRNKVMDVDTSIPNGPILVHCSAGIGRTGTFIALDYLLRQAEEEKYIDVYKTITDMRYQRTNFIQTNIQYEFLHNAISEALTISSMEVSQHDLPGYYQSLLEDNDVTGQTELKEQFELLNKMSPIPDPSVSTAGSDPENQTKNRYSNVLPVDTYRAYLSTPVTGSNEYINAVFLPTCSSKTGFLLTQMPLPNTVTDFWRLVYDQHVSHVVMMNNLNDDDEDEDVGEYWPSDDCTYGPFKIELLSCDNNKDFSIMNMQLTYSSMSRKKTLSVRQFRYEGWPDDRNVPQEPKSFIDFIKEVSKSYRTSTDQSDDPIIAHCMNGADRSGLYCVMAVIMERLQSEQSINIPQIILQLRGRRPQLIPTLEQFNFCYSAIADYLNDLEDSQIYSNVL